jgi:hypothetical protein|tara:strand:- start:654 stop:1658 length:1005 start_codon:yes stop_codon:yes gene_type:complete
MYAITRKLVRDEWNEFVDKHPAGWWWHRNEWLDYSLAYGDCITNDRSWALYDNNEVHAIFPCIEEKKSRDAVGRAAMGGTPCAGPLLGEHFTDNADEALMLLSVESKMLSRPLAWRWSYNNDHVEELVDALIRRISSNGFNAFRTGWWTSVVDVDRPEKERWKNIRKSYKSVINKANKTYDIEWSDDFNSYQKLHRDATNNCRGNFLTYIHQKRWMDAGFGKIVTAKERGVGNAGESVTPAPLQRVTAGASPASSTIASAYVIQYKDRAYYASGPSIRENVQAACLWEAMQVVRVPQFEVGWMAEPDGSANVEFFKKGFGGRMEPVLVVQTESW